mgnify:CR=1 FL=1
MKEKTKKWLKAAGVRALKTAAQAALAVVGTSTVFIHEINWLLVLSASTLAAVLSLITSLAGLPEVGKEE